MELSPDLLSMENTEAFEFRIVERSGKVALVSVV